MTASSIDSATLTDSPTEPKKSSTRAASSGRAPSPSAKAETPSPISAGVLGMTLTTRECIPSPRTIESIVIPAAIDTTRCAGVTTGRELREDLTHALRLNRQDQDLAVLYNIEIGLEDGDAGVDPAWHRHGELRAAASGSLATMEMGRPSQRPRAKHPPRTKAVAILPAPMKPQRLVIVPGGAVTDTSFIIAFHQPRV